MTQHTYDALIIGGGLAGFACAIKAAQNGQQVLLVERRPALGWEATWAGQLDLSGPDSSAREQLSAMISSVNGCRGNVLDAPITEMALDRLAQQAGIHVLLYSYPVRLIHDAEFAYGVVLGSKSGERILRARTLIDATEEAILWKQSGVELTEAATVPIAQSIFFNHASTGLTLPLDLGNGIVLHPSVWSGEVRAEFRVEDGDPLSARTHMPTVIERIRNEVPQLREALVSHIANDPFPTQPRFVPGSGPKHSRIGNLLGAGIWARETENTPAGRLALGETIGNMVGDCPVPTRFPDELMSGSVFSPPEISSDVLVVGGGTGGAIAAITAARRGVKTTLLEASSALGGIGAGGAIHWYYFGLNGGIQDEVDARVREITPLFAANWDVHGFHPEAKKCVLQQMAQEAGVDIRLNTVATGALLRGGKLRTNPEPGTSLAIQTDEEERDQLVGVLAATPDGTAVYGAQVFIDSTGDGDIAAMAGAPFIIGREKDNLPHAYSQPAGRLNPETGRLQFLNFDAGYVDPMDVEDLTRARRFGIQLFWQERFSDQNHQLYIAPLIGLRQSRQIVGEYQMTLADMVAGRRFDDAVSFVHTHYDNHAHDYENESDEAAFWVWALANWRKPLGCEVPYRSLLPRHVDGLLLACRALSMTFDAHAGFRMQKDIQRVGEAAGVIATHAVQHGKPLREIDLPSVQQELKQSDILADQFRPKPAIADTPVKQLPRAGELDADQAEQVLWLAIHQGTEGVAALTSMLASTDPQLRFRASSALAMRGAGEGVPELLRALTERIDDTPEGVRTVARWQAAIPFLGMAGDTTAVPELLKVLTDTELKLDVAIAAIRALGRIGDEAAIPGIQQALQRGDINTDRVIHGGGATSGINRVMEDARWQLDLAAAEALASLGGSTEETAALIAPYLQDTRSYVRRYATRVQREFGLH